MPEGLAGPMGMPESVYDFVPNAPPMRSERLRPVAQGLAHGTVEFPARSSTPDTCYRCGASTLDTSDEDEVGRQICRACLDLYGWCELCSNAFLAEYATGEGRACQDCYRSRVTCRECNDAMDTRVDRWHVANGYYYCQHCWNCESCGTRRDRCQCSEALAPYDYRPLVPNFLRLPSEGKKDKRDLYLGFELEVEAPGGRDDPYDDDNLRAYALQIKDDWPFCFFKRDGSLNHGFELVSHPMTPAYFAESRKTIIAGLGKLAKIGLRSYQPRTCGLHVHLSKTAFSSLHLYKFQKMFYDCKELAIVVSQRMHGNMNWCSLTAEDQKVLVQKAKERFGYERYVAVNIPQDGMTVEVRLYRGTLRPNSFFKSVQHALAVYYYTRVASMAKCNPWPFVSWVHDHSSEYPDLSEYLGRRWAKHKPRMSRSRQRAADDKTDP